MIRVTIEQFTEDEGLSPPILIARKTIEVDEPPGTLRAWTEILAWLEQNSQSAGDVLKTLILLHNATHPTPEPP